MKIRAVLITVIIGLLMSGCSKSGRDQVIRIANFPNVTHAQALVMRARSTLENEMGEGVDVEWSTFNAGPSVIEAMFAGQIDLAYIGPVPALNAFEKSRGDVLVIAGSATGGAALLVTRNSGISDVGDLDGKNVAIPQLGNTQHLYLLALLKENNLSPVSEGGSVNVIAVSNPDVPGLMDRGELDAALVPEPWASLLELNHGALPIKQDGKDDATTVVLVRKDFLIDNPELVAKFLDVHHGITLEIQENATEAKRDVNAQIELLTGRALPKEVLDSAFARIVFSDEIPMESLELYAEICMEIGLLQSLPDYGQMSPTTW